MTISSVATLQIIHEEDIESATPNGVEHIQDDRSHSVEAWRTQRRRVDGRRNFLIDSEVSRDNLTVENENLRAQLEVLSNELARKDTEMVRWCAQFSRIQRERNSFRKELDRFGPTNGLIDIPHFSIVNDDEQEQRLAPDLSCSGEAVKAKLGYAGNDSQQRPSPPLRPSPVLPSNLTGIPIHRGRLREQKAHKPKLLSPQAIGTVTPATTSPGLLESAHYSPIDHNKPPSIQPIQYPCRKSIHDMESFPSVESSSLSRSGSTSSMSSNCPPLLSESDSRSRNSSLSSVSSISHSGLQAHSSQSQSEASYFSDQSQEYLDTAFRGVPFRDHYDDMQSFVNTKYMGMDNELSIRGSGLETYIDAWNGRGSDAEPKDDLGSHTPMMAAIPRFKRLLRGRAADTGLSPTKQFSKNIESSVCNDAGQPNFTDNTTAPPSFNTNDVAAPFDSVTNAQFVPSHLCTACSGAAARQQPSEAPLISSGVTAGLTPSEVTSLVTNGKEVFMSNTGVIGHYATSEKKLAVPRPHTHASLYTPDLRPPSPIAAPHSPMRSSSPSRQSFPLSPDSSNTMFTPSAPSSNGLPYPFPRFQHPPLVQDDPDYGPVIVHGLLPSRHTIYRPCDGNHPPAARGRKEAFSVPPRHLKRGGTGR
ncbi:hypothetical protein BU17DRAFT_89370 [Hysterangium stoloniferum]|nr:hypothetical protein BU17DRAFT_89370 [Hysterangium stoloniferum]